MSIPRLGRFFAVDHDVVSLNNTLNLNNYSSVQSIDFSPTSEHVYYGKQNMLLIYPPISNNGKSINKFNIATAHDTVVISGVNGNVRRAKDQNMYVASVNQTDLQKISNPDATFAVNNFTLSTSPYKTTLGIPLQPHKILILDDNLITRKMKLKSYEINDHLGNVRVVVSDRKLSTLVSGVPQDYEPDIIATNNYYSFGSLQPNRHFGTENYDYGFDGMRMDNEISGSTGTSYDFGARQYDSRLGRWLSIDPLWKRYPSMSSFTSVANNPISIKEIDGRDWYILAWAPEAGLNQGHTAIAVENYKNIEGQMVPDGTYTVYEAAEIGTNDLAAWVKNPSQVVKGKVTKTFIKSKEDMLNATRHMGRTDKVDGVLQFSSSYKKDKVAKFNLDKYVVVSTEDPQDPWSSEDPSYTYTNTINYSLTTEDPTAFSCAGFIKCTSMDLYGVDLGPAENVNFSGTTVVTYSGVLKIPAQNVDAYTPGSVYKGGKAAGGKPLKNSGGKLDKPFVDAVSGGQIKDKTPNK